jgi:hypothetical protein
MKETEKTERKKTRNKPNMSNRKKENAEEKERNEWMDLGGDEQQQINVSFFLSFFSSFSFIVLGKHCCFAIYVFLRFLFCFVLRHPLFLGLLGSTDCFCQKCVLPSNLSLFSLSLCTCLSLCTYLSLCAYSSLSTYLSSSMSSSVHF